MTFLIETKPKGAFHKRRFFQALDSDTMSDDSHTSDGTDVTKIREAAEVAHRKFLLLFGKEQTPDQIVSAIESKLAESVT